MALKVLIFDVDGTLAETEKCHRQAFNLAFEQAGMDWHWSQAHYLDLLAVAGGQERIRHFAAQSAPDFLALPDLDQRIRALHRSKTEHYVRLVGGGGIALRPGVERLLFEARDQGLRLAIATTTTRANVVNLLTATLGAGGPAMFEIIAASDSAANKKPAPDVYFHVLEQLGCPAEACIAFEDSQNGLRAAHAAGIATVVTLSAFTACDDRRDALAVLSDLGEPERPFSLLHGDAGGQDYVSLDLLRAWRDRRE